MSSIAFNEVSIMSYVDRSKGDEVPREQKKKLQQTRQGKSESDSESCIIIWGLVNAIKFNRIFGYGVKVLSRLERLLR